MAEEVASSGSAKSKSASSGKLTGRAFKFGDNITTDHIAPGRYSHLLNDIEELAKHVLEDADPTFASRVRAGDFVVAGSNFGLGSSLEHVSAIVKKAGVGAVLAKSAARVFFRNSMSVGLPVLICNTDLIEDGDLLEIDLGSGVVDDVTRGVRLTVGRIPPAMLTILNEGGLSSRVVKNGDLEL